MTGCRNAPVGFTMYVCMHVCMYVIMYVCLVPVNLRT